jgi:ParB family chromosome partitioning protein
LNIDDITPNAKQPRTNFDPDDFAELVGSIGEFGVLQPISVRSLGKQNGVDKYELIMGERRYRAAKAAGLTSIPVIIRQTPDNELLRDALIENIHRSNLNPLEEGAAYAQLLSDFGCTHEVLAQRIGLVHRGKRCPQWRQFMRALLRNRHLCVHAGRRAARVRTPAAAK